MLVQSSGKGHETRLLNMPNIGRSLPGLKTLHDHSGLNRSESIDDNLALDGLNRVDDDTDRLRIQHLLRLLRLHISARQPASKPGMRVVPPNADLVPPDLLHHVHEFLLVHWIHSLNTNSGSTLRHGEYIDDTDGVVVVDLADHEAHHFERNTRSGVLKHFKQC